MKLKTTVSMAAIAALTALLWAVPAFAYDETYEQAGFAEPRPCYTCHGMVGAETTQTVDPAGREEPHLRKGPHGGYTSTTSKCSTCHTVHAAPADGFKLLPAATIRSTCEHCHDGTGGQGVYGVIKARTGYDPSADPFGAAHRIEVEGNNVVVGGDPEGGDRVQQFSGPGGTLTCSDCHSPHDGNTVEPFLGDRWRSADGESPAETNRLLRVRPTGGAIDAQYYGTDWCLSCHQGHGEIEGLSTAVNHPAGGEADGYHYDNVARYVDDSGTPSYEMGPLGQSNAGYVLPDWPAGYAPICQQCHEDVRRVGRVTPRTLDPSEEFTITAPDGLPGDGQGGSTDNPRFQVFPHESEARSFLIVDTDVDGMDALCLNCHTMGG